MGAPKATATPAAQAALRISRRFAIQNYHADVAHVCEKETDLHCFRIWGEID